jgi:hypothetical protein
MKNSFETESGWKISTDFKTSGSVFIEAINIGDETSYQIAGTIDDDLRAYLARGGVALSDSEWETYRASLESAGSQKH